MNAIDTNVLIYAYDESSPEKRARARELLATLSDGVLLWQVACEFVAASRKTLPNGADPATIWDRLDEIREAFPLILPSAAVLQRNKSLHLVKQVQFWDAMIYAGCAEAGVRRAYSEDLPGAVVEGLEIVNLFE